MGLGMSETDASSGKKHRPCQYQIRIEGHLADRWADWFGGLSIMLEENGDTVLTGPVPDQAALHGILRQVRNLGMPLISLIRVDNESSSRYGTGRVETPQSDSQ